MSAAPEATPRVVVGGVGELWQGDNDLGRLAAELLAAEAPADVLVEEMSYGALHAAMLLEDTHPELLVVVGAAARGRPPGTVERYAVEARRVAYDDVRYVLGEAVTGYVSIELLLDVCAALGVLPGRTVVVEVEPAHTEPGAPLSPEAAAGLAEALELVRGELYAGSRTPSA